MFLENNVVVVVVEKHRDGTEFGWSAAGLGHFIWSEKVNLPKESVQLREAYTGLPGPCFKSLAQKNT